MSRRQLAAEYVPKLLRDCNSGENNPLPEWYITQAAGINGHVYPIVDRALATLVRDGDIKTRTRIAQRDTFESKETVYWI